MLRLPVFGLVLGMISAHAQIVCSTTVYPAEGDTLVTYDLTFPGDPYCAPGTVTNALGYFCSTTGTAGCPSRFDESSRQWRFDMTYTSDYFGNSKGAGCWAGIGPAVFAHSTHDCSIAGDICEDVYVTELGQYVGVGAGGFFLAGDTHYFGSTACWPADASASVEFCHGCPGSLACPAGAYPKCTSSGWTCSDGSAGCVTPPPYYDCGANAQLICGSNGWTCQCVGGACGVNCPIIVDTRDEGFHLTDAQHGVWFEFLPHASPIRLGWTDPDYGNGFLALDRDGDGRISNGTELFGNITPQPQSDEPNGFLALSVFDDPTNGGDGNGFIGPDDSIYEQLRVWIDADHDGISDLGELKSLPEVGIFRIALRYHNSRFVDQFGNEFRFRGAIWGGDADRERDACYDVFLTSQPGQGQ